MDVWTPTHELTRAHAVLRARRRIAEAKPDWALSAAGLRGRGGRGEHKQELDKQIDIESGDADAGADDVPLVAATDDRLADVFSAVDAAIAHADRTLTMETATQARQPPEQDPLVYDLDWDEDERMNEWRAIVAATRTRRRRLEHDRAAATYALARPPARR